MSVINILAKLPTEIKERIENPTALRINNDFPGLYLPKENAEELNHLLKDLKVELEKKEKSNKIKKQIKLITNMNKVIERKIIE